MRTSSTPSASITRSSPVGGARSVGQAAGHDRHLVTARGEVHGLPVNVLGDAPELRVVVVRENADAHVPGSAQSARSAS